MSLIDLFLLGYLVLSVPLLLALWQAGTGRRVFERAVGREPEFGSQDGAGGWTPAGADDLRSRTAS